LADTKQVLISVMFIKTLGFYLDDTKLINYIFDFQEGCIVIDVKSMWTLKVQIIECSAGYAFDLSINHMRTKLNEVGFA